MSIVLTLEPEIEAHLREMPRAAVQESVMPQQAPYGAWKSPITSNLIVAGTVRLGEIQADGSDIYFSESRPSEEGRSVVVRLALGASPQDINPPPFNARTRVHEYGGGAFRAHRGAVYFSNYADQRLYRVRPGGDPVPLTPEGLWRYADAVVDEGRSQLICILEDHANAGHEPVNSVAAVPLEGGQPRVLTSGYDFYSTPRLSPDGRRLCWLCWNHPNMPWDGTELWVAECGEDGLQNAQRVAGGPDESIFQPSWSPDGILYFVSDRTGWWNLYRLIHGEIEALHPMQAEFGLPQWVFGQSTYAFLDSARVVCVYAQGGVDHLALLDLPRRQFHTLTVSPPPRSTEDHPAPLTSFDSVAVCGKTVVFQAASPTQPPCFFQFEPESGQLELLRCSSSLAVDPAYLSIPAAVEFPTTGEKTAYGFYYAPVNPDYTAPPAEKPPLLVISHGGPTGASSAVLSYQVQFWTSRGFAVLSVNYGGSTGYGREYRERLKGQWGVVDVDDCVNGAQYLVQRGDVDGRRLAIRGGSAGGYTTLSALTFRNVFQAGASHFGVSSLEGLAKDTHKFESRYLDGLIAPYPEGAALYRERSPLFAAERLSSPVIFFQGLEDAVVPPAQAELMVDALRRRGIPVAYVAFEGEQHGFRRAANIKRSLDAELYFYSRIFNFPLAEPIEPVVIENLAGRP